MKKILIVDDEQLLLQGLGKVLHSDAAEVEVVTAETGEAALREISSSPYHLCFLDVSLPGIDGVEALKRIREISPGTKVIVMTAGVVTNKMQADIESNAYMFITKPFDLLQVKMMTKRILEEGG